MSDDRLRARTPSRGDADATAEARVRRTAGWLAPRPPPLGRLEDVERWREACQRAEWSAEAADWAADHPWRPTVVRHFRAEMARWTGVRPLLVPVPREVVTTVEAVDPRQLALWGEK